MTTKSQIYYFKFRISAAIICVASCGYAVAQDRPSDEASEMLQITPLDESKATMILQSEPDTSDSEEISSSGPIYWAERTMDMRFGLQFNSGNDLCLNLHATLPFPMTWPEQKVELESFVIPDSARYYLRPNKLGVGEIVLDIQQMNPHDVMDIYAKVHIQKSFIKAPADPSKLVIAKSPQRDKELSVYLGDSPFIETRTRQIRQIAGEIRDAEHANAWQHVEAIYDWVREKIVYQNGDAKSTSDALKDGTGDCEEMSGLFIAICRASNIPARVVWVPDHCYPEFYLEDQAGTGYWFPCQAAGQRQFGEINEYRPILQKGDRFRTPESGKSVRYLAETFTCKLRGPGTIAPSITAIKDLGPLQAEIDAQQQAATK